MLARVLATFYAGNSTMGTLAHVMCGCMHVCMWACGRVYVCVYAC